MHLKQEYLNPSKKKKKMLNVKDNNMKDYVDCDSWI